MKRRTLEYNLTELAWNYSEGIIDISEIIFLIREKGKLESTRSLIKWILKDSALSVKNQEKAKQLKREIRCRYKNKHSN